MAKTTKKSSQKKSTAKTKRQPKGMVDPTRLKPFTIDAEENHGSGTSDKGDKLLQVIVETPKGSHNKYSWDATQKIFVLKTALPSGMVFPYDFGFVPQTQAPDGDPLDVLVMMDAPAFPGCAMMTRLIGVIEGEQVEEGEKPTRNDRLVAVAETTHMYAKFTRLKDMPKQALKEIEEFFVNYHKLQGKRYRLLGIRGQKAALRLIGQMRKPSR